MATKADLIYEDTNVYEAALKRIARIYESHDECWVSYSGGKDSLVTLKLIEEYHDIIGSSDKINVVFRDEEIIQHAIREFVLETAKNPRYNFVYLATPLVSELFVLGVKTKYIQWDDNREWVCPKPDIATRVEGVWKQEEIDQIFFAGKGHKKLAVFLGLRADESLIRFSGITNSTIPYLTKSLNMKNLMMAKPVYDWNQKDIFKYIHDKGIDYCQVYDHQVYNKNELRVASEVHAEAAKNLSKLKTIDPVLYNQIMQVFPEVDIQARYYKDAIKGQSNRIAWHYLELTGDPWRAIYQYIEDKIECPTSKKTALQRVTSVRKTRGNKSDPADPLGGYPALYVFHKIIGGGYKRPINPTGNRTDAYLEFEGISNRA